MKRRTLLATASAIALAAVGYRHLASENGPDGPITRQPRGDTTINGPITRKRIVDYQTIISEAVAEKAAFLTMTLSGDIVRDRYLEKSIKYTPFPKSTALVRVKYHVEYPIGYALEPSKFAVSGGQDGLVITLHRPRLIAEPAVRLLSYDILESGILIDEKVAIIELQQRIQPESRQLAKAVLRRDDVIPVSERKLRAFLQPVLAQQSGEDPPPITFKYR